jgi:hypothetical protein
MLRQPRSPITRTLAHFVSEIRFFWRNAMKFEAGVAEMPLRLRSSSYVFSQWQNHLNTDLTNKVSASQVNQMRLLFIVGQTRPSFQTLQLAFDGQNAQEAPP